MNTKFMLLNPLKSFFRVLLFLAAVFFLNNCQDEPQLWKVKSQEQVIGDYITSHADDYSEFEKLMDATGLRALLNVRGPYTLFLPTDEAMYNYYELKGVGSFEELSDTLQKELILNHLISMQIESGDFGLGAIRETNAIGDYLVTEFDGSDIIVGKYAKIIDRDVRTANGFIHVIDHVLDPVKQDLYTIVSNNPSYSIFGEGLNITGLKDTLRIITFPFGTKTARTRFTVLAVPDTIYNRYGIYNVNDLVEWCGSDMDSLDYLNNPFYRYMEYHCLNGSYYLSDLNTGVYPILSRDNNLSVTIDNDYKINLDKKTDLYTGFIIPASNTPAKNGALHCVNDILPVIEPEPAVVIFQTTDFFDIQQGDYFHKYYKRWFDGAGTFEKIKWEGDYMLYYIKESATVLMDNDCLSMLGWFSVSVTFPKVMKGKYTVSIFQPGWNDVTDCIAYLDGVRTNYTYTGPYGGTGGNGGLQVIADADFPTTTEHTLTLKNITFGMLFWDYIRFDPVK